MHITLSQAAKYLGASEATMRRWMRERALPAHKINERLYLNAIELWEWATKEGLPVSRSLLDEARHADEVLPPLAALIASGGVHYDVGGTSKRDVLHEVVARLPLPPEFDRDFLLAVLEARERIGSSGLGHGIAIPHVRHPIILHVPSPFVTLCMLRNPIEFGALDGLPVHAIFVVVAPSVPGHLQILAQLAFALRDEIVRHLIRDRRPADEILAGFDAVAEITTDSHRAITAP